MRVHLFLIETQRYEVLKDKDGDIYVVDAEIKGEIKGL